MNQNRIRAVSLFFRGFFQLILIGLPIVLVLAWLVAPNSLILLNGFIKFDAIPASYSGLHHYVNGSEQKILLHALTMQEKCLGFLLSLIPTFIQMYVVYMLIKIFSLYSQGEIFSAHHVRYTRIIGYALLLGQLIEPIYQFVMGIILTLHNPPGYRFAAITLDQTNIGLVLTALLLILISWILNEGFKLQQETQLTI